MATKKRPHIVDDVVDDAIAEAQAELQKRKRQAIGACIGGACELADAFGSPSLRQLRAIAGEAFELLGPEGVAAVRQGDWLEAAEAVLRRRKARNRREP